MRIAVTGGIGVGKSEVMKVIKRLGYVTVSADEINARLLDSPDYIRKIAQEFTPAVEDGKIDRATLREIVFNDEEERKKLNALAHPVIRAEIENVKGTWIFVEIPLLRESGMNDMFDKVICVTAPKRVRIKRIMERSGLTGEMAEKIIDAQLSDDERKKDADFIIENDGALSDLYTAVTRVLARLQ